MALTGAVRALMFCVPPPLLRAPTPLTGLAAFRPAQGVEGFCHIYSTPHGMSELQSMACAAQLYSQTADAQVCRAPSKLQLRTRLDLELSFRVSRGGAGTRQSIGLLCTWGCCCCCCCAPDLAGAPWPPPQQRESAASETVEAHEALPAPLAPDDLHRAGGRPLRYARLTDQYRNFGASTASHEKWCSCMHFWMQ